MPRSQLPLLRSVGFIIRAARFRALRVSAQAVVDCRPLSHGQPAQTTVLSSDRHVLRSLGRGAHRARVPQETSRRRRRRHRRLHIHRRRHAHASWADHRIHVFDGRQPLRPTQEFRGAGSERDWNRISSRRCAAARRCGKNPIVAEAVSRRANSVLRVPRRGCARGDQRRNDAASKSTLGRGHHARRKLNQLRSPHLSSPE